MRSRRQNLTALARAVLAGTTLLGCGPQAGSPRTAATGDSVVERDAGGGADASFFDAAVADAAVADAAVADAGAADSGVVRIYCWLVPDPRCLADGGTAPGVVDAC